MSWEVRFFAKVQKGEADACWAWTGARLKRVAPLSYGVFTLPKRAAILGTQGLSAGRTQLAHRLMYVLSQGTLEEGLMVLHRCNNKQCVNPAHLYAGTRADNAHDCLVANETNVAKLRVEDVVRLRRICDAIKRRYGIGGSALGFVGDRITWNWVPERSLK